MSRAEKMTVVHQHGAAPVPHELPILIVEDDESLARELVEQIRNAGYVVHHCPTATEAAESVSKTLYGLIILDLLLPDVSSVYELNKLRSLAPQFRPPVLMVTASNVENFRSVDRSRVKAIIFKPFDFSLVIAYAEATYKKPAAAFPPLNSRSCRRAVAECMLRSQIAQ